MLRFHWPTFAKKAQAATEAPFAPKGRPAAGFSDPGPFFFFEKMAAHNLTNAFLGVRSPQFGHLFFRGSKDASPNPEFHVGYIFLIFVFGPLQGTKRHN